MQCSRKKWKCFSSTNFWSVVSKKIFWTWRSDKARPEFFELVCSIFWKQWQLSRILNWNEFFVDSLLDSTKVILRDKRFFWGMSQILRLSLQVRYILKFVWVLLRWVTAKGLKVRIARSDFQQRKQRNWVIHFVRTSFRVLIKVTFHWQMIQKKLFIQKVKCKISIRSIGIFKIKSLKLFA